MKIILFPKLGNPILGHQGLNLFKSVMESVGFLILPEYMVYVYVCINILQYIQIVHVYIYIYIYMYTHTHTRIYV